jgi:hypothetical protein
MAFLRRRTDPDETSRPVTREQTERAGASPGLVRALFTLVGVAAAGFLVWLAQTLDYAGSTTEFWIAAGLLAGAGLALGLSQLFGGWTKWGWPTLSPGVFLLGFLPTLVLGGWILLAKQPQGGVEEGRFDRWSSDLGVSGFVDAVFELWPAIPLVIGLILAFSFDTTGPRTQVLHDRDVPDEDVHDYRSERTTAPATPVGARTTERERSDTTVAEELRGRGERSDADRRTTA